MRINVPKGTNLKITPDIQSYLDKKLEPISKLSDARDPDGLLDVELERTTRHHEKGEIYRAEMNLSVKGAFYRAEEESIDIFSAIDLVKDEILRELRSDKDKKTSLLRRSGLAVKNTLKGIYEWPIRKVKGWRGESKLPPETF